jgi:hypothetical protein
MCSASIGVAEQLFKGAVYQLIFIKVLSPAGSAFLLTSLKILAILCIREWYHIVILFVYF